ncbi:MAG TPA: cellulose binding domain-containing protein [Micromonosporaceae bacterium]|nr:cellulose binding domain-containing protein [Micromonosporaceae bacterium]
MRKHFAVCAAAVLVSALTVLVAEPAYAATATFSRTSTWETGYEAKFVVTNNTSTTITSWNVQFDLPTGTSIGSFWDALITRSGQHYTAVNAGWNGTLGPNASTSFGFVAAGTGNPTNCTVNGASCSGGSPPPPPPPGVPGVPGNFRVTGTTNSSISLAWNAVSGTVTGYRVYEGSTLRATVGGTSTTISGLGTCTAHTYVVRAYNSVGESASSNSASATTGGCQGSGAMAAAPYLYEGWGNPPSPSTVMGATGIRWFTMAFMLSSGGCNPAWDSSRPLQGGVDAQAISQIRAGGGDVIPSFGGWSGNKLGPNCSTASALAGAYQQVINAYNLRAIDIDIENIDEFENEAVQDRILSALKIVKQNNPNIKTIITFGTTTTGPNFWGNRLITRSAALQANIDVYTIMPFDFGGGANMAQNTMNAAEGLKNALKSAFGWSDDTAYRHMGISGMNGLSDQQELTSPSTWQQVRDWAQARHLARLAFWSVNRDRPCPGGGVVSDCSGISQSNWQFTAITATFTG